MEKKIASILIVFLIFASMETVKPDAFDCYDGCITACVQPNTRLMQRCELKCGIRCDRGTQAQSSLG
ncbi:hypothetical protein M5689_009812 [Euphorbia peplus]|nr:hypothetical protein M5689_009812 [Euphorbia peplus]